MAGALEAHAVAGTICFQNSAGDLSGSPSRSSRQDSNLYPSPSEGGAGGAPPIELRDVSVLDLAVPVEIVQPAVVKIVRWKFTLCRIQLMRVRLDRHLERAHISAIG